MAKRVFSQIEKFKRVEQSLRGAGVSLRETIERIDEALTGRRTEGETALLRSLRDQVARLRLDTFTVLHRLYSEVESSGD